VYHLPNETSLPKGVALRDGGYDKIYAYLEAIYQSVVEKDISQRYEIREVRTFSNVVKFVASNIGSILSPSNIASALSQEGQKAISHAGKILPSRPGLIKHISWKRADDG
jgi:predicted AAA+ superfamily ATPase